MPDTTDRAATLAILRTLLEVTPGHLTVIVQQDGKDLARFESWPPPEAPSVMRVPRWRR